MIDHGQRTLFDAPPPNGPPNSSTQPGGGHPDGIGKFTEQVIRRCICGTRIPNEKVTALLRDPSVKSFACRHCKIEFTRDDFYVGPKAAGTYSCPACGTDLTQYNRVLNSGMAICLVKLFVLTRDNPDGVEWFHHSKFDIHDSREIHKMAHWGLVEEKEREDEEKGKKKNSGSWRITERGRQFVTGAITLPSHVHVLPDNRMADLNGDPIGIRDALGKDFNLDELLNTR